MKVFGIKMERRSLLYVLGDAALAVLALAVATAIRFELPLFDVSVGRMISDHTGGIALFVLTHVLMLYVAETYDPARDFLRLRQMVRVWAALGVAAVCQMVLYYALPNWQLGRGVVVLANVGFLFAITGWRLTMGLFRPRLSRRRRTLILGDDPSGHVIAKAIREDPERRDRYELLGFISAPEWPGRPALEVPKEEPVAAPIAADLQVVGKAEDLANLINLAAVDCIIVAIRSGMPPWLTQLLLEKKASGVQIEDLRVVYKDITGKVPIQYLSDTSFIFGPEFAGSNGVGAALQRLADITIATVGLLLSAPIIIVAAWYIKKDSRGPVFYSQVRVGQNEENFTIWKLRTMGVDAEAKSGAVWSQGAGDPRVTPVGRILRRTRIDELPQFWNVLMGEMSMVGPRPERPHFVAQLKQEIPFYSLRFAVKPGVTGWAQVRYRYGASVDDSAEKLCYDLFAIQELSPILYSMIILKTVQTVLLKPGS